MSQLKRMLVPGGGVKQLLHLYWQVVLVALIIRLAVMPFLLPEQLNPVLDHWPFGYEAGRLARSLAEGRGFGNPLFAPTGPSAWMTPVYPGILALIFKLLGVYTVGSAVAALSFNAVVSALTCIPTALIAKECFGERYAGRAAWAWALLPYSVYFPMERMWETWLATLFLAVLVWAVVRRDAAFSTLFWILHALLWATAALTSPTLCVLLPLLAGYALLRLARQGQPWFRKGLLFGLLVFAGISPWIARNYIVFHRIIPMRDAFGLSLRLGTPGERSYHWSQYNLGPWHNQAEWAEFQQHGELPYMDRELRLAKAAIRANPSYFILRSFRRALFMWTGFWSFDRTYLSEEPMDLPNIPLCTTFTLLSLIGLLRLWRIDRGRATLMALCLSIFPVIYYTTSPEQYYRRPLDALMVVLAVAAFKPGMGRGKAQEVETSEENVSKNAVLV